MNIDALKSSFSEQFGKDAVPAGPSLLYFIMRGRALADPERVLDVFRSIVDRWGDVISFRSGLKERTYIVENPTVAAEIFGAQDMFVKYPNPTADLKKLQAMIGKGMLATHTDSDWEAHRRSVARNFAKMRVMTQYGPIVAQHVSAFVECAAAAPDGVCNISELSMQLSGRIMSDILAPGHASADESFLEIKKILDQGILEFHRVDFIRRAKPYKAALRRQAQRLIDCAVENQHKPEDGIIARFMSDEPEWRTDEAAHERLLDRAINMVVAGFETTATTMNWILYLLAAHPAEQERLHAEITAERLDERSAGEVFDERTLLHRAVLEAMRLYSVLWFNIRYAVRDVTIAGHRFKNGSRVMLLPFLTNRDPRLFRDPDNFRPDRYLDGEPLPIHPFGHGPRVCIGRTLAEMEMQAITAALLRRFRLEPVTVPRAIGGVLLQPNADVMVRCVPR
jgi:cytochrome P450